MAQVALAWVLNNPVVAAPIVGPTRAAPDRRRRGGRPRAHRRGGRGARGAVHAALPSGLSMSTHGVSFPANQTGDRRPPPSRGRWSPRRCAPPTRWADAAARETAWRSRYLLHFRRLVEAGLKRLRTRGTRSRTPAWTPHDAVGGRRLTDGGDLPLASLATHPRTGPPTPSRSTAKGEPLTELVLPYRGRRLTGADAATPSSTRGSGAGVLEPTAAAAVREVAAHPEWLRLEGRTVAVLGAGAEMGPLGAAAALGATVAAVDLPTPAVWERVLRTAHEAAGRLLPGPGRAGHAKDAGVDLLAEVRRPRTGWPDFDGRPGRRQLPVRRRRHARAGLDGRRRPGLAGDRGAAGHGPGVPGHARPTCSSVPGEAVEHSAPGVRRAVRHGEARRPSAPLGLTRPAAAPRSTRPAPTPASPTAWCPSRARTTRWPRGSSGGGPRRRDGTGRRCRSTSRRRPAPARW